MRLLDSFLVLLALAGLGATGWWGMYQSEFTPASLEARLGALTQAALEEAGHDWAVATMDGQTVILSGAPPSPEAGEAAIVVAALAAGPGGQIFGGVTQVETRFEAAQVSEHETGGNSSENGRILLGQISSDAGADYVSRPHASMTDGS